MFRINAPQVVCSILNVEGFILIFIGCKLYGFLTEQFKRILLNVEPRRVPLKVYLIKHETTKVNLKNFAQGYFMCSKNALNKQVNITSKTSTLSLDVRNVSKNKDHEYKYIDILCQETPLLSCNCS